jgi:hypothetical protein
VSLFGGVPAVALGQQIGGEMRIDRQGLLGIQPASPTGLKGRH